MSSFPQHNHSGGFVPPLIVYLNARGIRTSRGNRFNKCSLKRMFANRKYIGEYHYRDVVVPDSMPAIIPKEVAKQPTVTKEMILFVLRRFRDLDMRVQKNRERLIDGLIKAIIVYDDQFALFLTYYDEPITIPTNEEIDEMKASSPVEALSSPKP